MKKSTIVKIIAIWLIIGFIVSIGKTYIQQMPLSAEMVSSGNSEEPVEEEVVYAYDSEEYSSNSEIPLPISALPDTTYDAELVRPSPIFSEPVLVSLITTIGALLNSMILLFKNSKSRQ